MSDLTATNCGCNDSCGCANAQNNGIFGGNSCVWIILLLLFCGGNGNGCGCNNGSLFSNNGSCCDWIIWILLLSYFCGGNGLIGNSNGNGCGCNNSCC